MPRQFKNQSGAGTTLSASAAIGATSLSVTDGSIFSATGPFSIRIENASTPTTYEIVNVTARSVNTLTVDATTLAWSAGDKVFQVVAATDLDAFAENADLSAYQALSVIDAKGDLIVGTANDTTTRKAVGANGSVPVADSGDATGIAWRLPATAAVDTAETTASTTYTDLATVGPAATVTVGASGMALVFIGARMSNDNAGNAARMSFAVSGATTSAATEARRVDVLNPAGVTNVGITVSRAILVTGLTPGSNTFTAKYLASAGTSTFSLRNIVVVPL